MEGITNDNIDLSVDLIKNALVPFLESILGQKDLVKINIKQRGFRELACGQVEI